MVSSLPSQHFGSYYYLSKTLIRFVDTARRTMVSAGLVALLLARLLMMIDGLSRPST
jgi:hypothetical protein